MIRDRAQSSVFHLLTSDLIAGGYGLRFQAVGRSMLPTIQDGEIVHIKPVAPDMLKIGDIVLLRTGEQFKAHRIIRKCGQCFITRGDAGVDTDGEIRCDQILGRVTAKEAMNSRRLVRLDGVKARLEFLALEVRRRGASFVFSARHNGKPGSPCARTLNRYHKTIAHSEKTLPQERAKADSNIASAMRSFMQDRTLRDYSKVA
ncbi:MAG: S24/S26 family peptidase [Terriglobales bacterium]